MDTELAYLAGFLDGEGSIAVGLNKGPGGRRRWYLRLTCHQVNPEPLKLLKERFGGAILRTERTGTQRTIYEWIAGNKIAADAIAALRPHLIVKAAEADVALRFQALMTSRSERRIGLTGDQESERQAAYEELRRLKRVEYDWDPGTVKRIAKPKPVPRVRVRVVTPVKSTGYDRGKKPERDILAAEYMLNGPNWIAGKYGVSRQTVFNWLDSYGIPRQGRTPASEARRKAAVAASWKSSSSEGQ
jgi:hypothetical protein